MKCSMGQLPTYQQIKLTCHSIYHPGDRSSAYDSTLKKTVKFLHTHPTHPAKPRRKQPLWHLLLRGSCEEQRRPSRLLYASSLLWSSTALARHQQALGLRQGGCRTDSRYKCAGSILKSQINLLHLDILQLI